MASSRRHLQRPGQEFRDALVANACGGMIGTAILLPLANSVEGLSFQSV